MLRFTGEVQFANVASSREHWNVEPVSFAENLSVASLFCVDPVGPSSIVVSGAVLSTGAVVICHVWSDGV